MVPSLMPQSSSHHLACVSSGPSGPTLMACRLSLTPKCLKWRFIGPLEARRCQTLGPTNPRRDRLPFGVRSTMRFRR